MDAYANENNATKEPKREHLCASQHHVYHKTEISRFPIFYIQNSFSLYFLKGQHFIAYPI